MKKTIQGSVLAEIQVSISVLTDLDKQCVCGKFCLKLAKTFTEISQMLKQAYGTYCVSHSRCYEWYQCFKSAKRPPKTIPKPKQNVHR
jgi:hypothetical protein